MNLFTLDFGKTNAFCFNATTEEISKITAEQVLTLDLPELSAGDLVVIEDAHLRSRERNSLAQYFNYVELVTLKNNAEAKGVEIRLFPQQSSPKCRTLYELDKTDENDVVVIGKYLKDFPHIQKTLKKFRPKTLAEYQDIYKDMWADRESLNQHMNVARNLGYPDDGNCGVERWISANIEEIFNVLTEEERQFVGLRKVYAGTAREKISPKRKCRQRLHTLVATLLTTDGGPRLRTGTEKLPHWKYVRETYFGLTPYHQRGGIAASNIKHHLRGTVSVLETSKGDLTKELVPAFHEARNDVDKQIRGIWRKLRSLVAASVY